VKQFYDPLEEFVFGSPQHIEEHIYQKEFGYSEIISDSFLNGVNFFLHRIAEELLKRFRDAESQKRKPKYDRKEHPTDFINHCEIMDAWVDYNWDNRRFVLYWIRNRPCAEGMGFYNVILYWFVHIAAQCPNVGVEINDCLSVNQVIMKNKGWHEEKEFDSRPDFNRDKYHYFLTSAECAAQDSLDFWKIQNKVLSYGNTAIELNPAQFDRSDKLNDYGHVENKFYRNDRAYDLHVNHFVTQKMKDLETSSSSRASRSIRSPESGHQLKSRRTSKMSDGDIQKARERFKVEQMRADWRKIQAALRKYPGSSPITSRLQPAGNAEPATSMPPPAEVFQVAPVPPPPESEVAAGDVSDVEDAMDGNVQEPEYRSSTCTLEQFYMDNGERLMPGHNLYEPYVSWLLQKVSAFHSVLLDA